MPLKDFFNFISLFKEISLGIAMTELKSSSQLLLPDDVY